jgi:hypothetical protein
MTMEKKVYQKIASTFNAYQNCIVSGNQEWKDRHEKTINDIMENNLPNGYGFDIGISFDFENSKDNKLIMLSSYHLMNDNGMYDGWIDFKIIVKPSLAFGFTIDIIGPFSRLRSCHYGLKDYIAEIIDHCLNKTI